MWEFALTKTLRIDDPPNNIRKNGTIDATFNGLNDKSFFLKKTLPLEEQICAVNWQLLLALENKVHSFSVIDYKGQWGPLRFNTDGVNHAAVYPKLCSSIDKLVILFPEQNSKLHNSWWGQIKEKEAQVSYKQTLLEVRSFL